MKVQGKSARLFDMLLTMKKILASLLLPLPICLILLLTGLILIIWTRLRKTGITIISAGIVVLLIFSVNPVATDLLIHLEKQYHPLTKMPENIKYIVVLGGGNGGSRQYPPNTRLSSASLARLVEAVRLYRQNPNHILILSGGGVFGSRADATVMNNTALALGVNRNNMIIEAGSRDTVEEAKYLKSLIKNNKFILVTSAYHMPRAMQIFKEQNMNPIPAPTQFLTNRYIYNPKYYFPSVANLIHSDIALHEYMGIFYLRMQRMFSK